ncbi:MAG: hypothetical protein HBSAPP03_01210 [Phycisphaerae bacterium]|nr:MAG: hypothetical protein HBSAPP03_01210 [Phycisphaerae bacterium]
MVTLAESLAPTWVVLPVAGFTLLIVASHVLLVTKADMPASRRRIRAMGGLLMMLTLPVMSYALCLADPVHGPREFVLSWMLTTGLLVLVMALAGLDVVNTWRLHRAGMKALRRELRDAHAAAVPDAPKA